MALLRHPPGRTIGPDERPLRDAAVALGVVVATLAVLVLAPVLAGLRLPLP